MQRLATLTAALLTAVQPMALRGQAPVPADAPKGEPPYLTYVVGDATGRSIFQLVRPPEGVVVGVFTPDGKPDPEAARALAAKGPFLDPLNAAGLTVRTRDGKPLSYAEASKRVKDGAVAALFYTRAGSSPHPTYLKALSADTLVFSVEVGAAPAQK